MKMTVLEMVQDILNDMDGDPVNNIGDTEESSQIANIIKTTYFELMTQRNAPHLRLVTTLDNVSDTDHPNYLKIPEDTIKLEYVAYNQRTSGSDPDEIKEIAYLSPSDFLRKLQNRNASASDVQVVIDFGGSKLNILNDQPPSYYTSFDDEYVVFDSWVEAITNTMIEGDSQVILYKVPDFTISDTFTPSIPGEWFPYLLAEAKSAAIYKLRQVADQKEEQKSKRQARLMSQRGQRLNGSIRYPNYGRPRKGSRVQSHLPRE